MANQITLDQTEIEVAICEYLNRRGFDPENQKRIMMAMTAERRIVAAVPCDPIKPQERRWISGPGVLTPLSPRLT